MGVRWQHMPRDRPLTHLQEKELRSLKKWLLPGLAWKVLDRLSVFCARMRKVLTEAWDTPKHHRGQPERTRTGLAWDRWADESSEDELQPAAGSEGPRTL